MFICIYLQLSTRFKGSSLKLLGSLPNDVNDEWAIIGWTGEFSFAQGSVKYKQVLVDPAGIVVRELNISVLCTNKPVKRVSLHRISNM